MSAKELTIPEMQKALTDIKTNFDTYKASTETQIKDLTSQNKTLKADTEKMKEEIKEKEEKQAKGGAKFHKAMKAAMEEKDEEKKAEMIKEAMKHYKADDDPGQEDDKEKEAMKAKLTILTAEVTKPRINYLKAAFKGRVDDKTLETYVAQWSKLDIEQLDAKITEVKAFVGQNMTVTVKPDAEPLGFSTMEAPKPFEASVADEYSGKVEKMTVQELFA